MENWQKHFGGFKTWLMTYVMECGRPNAANYIQYIDIYIKV